MSDGPPPHYRGADGHGRRRSVELVRATRRPVRRRRPPSGPFELEPRGRHVVAVHPPAAAGPVAAARAAVPPLGRRPVFSTDKPGMHATDTLDLVILDGTIELEVEDGVCGSAPATASCSAARSTGGGWWATVRARISRAMSRLIRLRHRRRSTSRRVRGAGRRAKVRDGGDRGRPARPIDHRQRRRGAQRRRVPPRRRDDVQPSCGRPAARSGHRCRAANAGAVSAARPARHGHGVEVHRVPARRCAPTSTARSCAPRCRQWRRAW